MSFEAQKRSRIMALFIHTVGCRRGGLSSPLSSHLSPENESRWFAECLHCIEGSAARSNTVSVDYFKIKFLPLKNIFWNMNFPFSSHIPHCQVPLCAITPRVCLSRAASPTGKMAGFTVIWVLISPLFNPCIFSAVFRVRTLRDTCPLKFYIHLSLFLNIHVHCIPAVLYLLVVVYSAMRHDTNNVYFDSNTATLFLSPRHYVEVSV